MVEKKNPKLDNAAERALELHRIEGEMLRALAPLEPAARARAFAAVLVMQSTELAQSTIATYMRGGFKLDAVGIDASVSLSYDKEGGTDG